MLQSFDEHFSGHSSRTHIKSISRAASSKHQEQHQEHNNISKSISSFIGDISKNIVHYASQMTIPQGSFVEDMIYVPDYEMQLLYIPKG